jgi:hypothetical protein
MNDVRRLLMLRQQLNQYAGLDLQPDLLARLDDVINDLADLAGSDYIVVMDAICEVLLHVQSPEATGTLADGLV